MEFRYQKLPIGNPHPQAPLIARPFIPVYLIGKTSKTESPYFALLDSGADRIIFPAELAEVVGIDRIESGRLEATVGIANQRTDVFYFNLELNLLGDDKNFPSEVGFARGCEIPILGRSFFKHFKKVIFSEAKETVELKN